MQQVSSFKELSKQLDQNAIFYLGRKSCPYCVEFQPALNFLASMCNNAARDFANNPCGSKENEIPKIIAFENEDILDMYEKETGIRLRGVPSLMMKRDDGAIYVYGQTPEKISRQLFDFLYPCLSIQDGQVMDYDGTLYKVKEDGDEITNPINQLEVRDPEAIMKGYARFSGIASLYPRDIHLENIFNQPEDIRAIVFLDPLLDFIPAFQPDLCETNIENVSEALGTELLKNIDLYKKYVQVISPETFSVTMITPSVIFPKKSNKPLLFAEAVKAWKEFKKTLL